MIVLDASAAIDWLLQTSAGQHIDKRIYSHNESLHAPHLLDLEVTQIIAASSIARGDLWTSC
jgi:predicted nucleic acid-binding protein